MAQLCSVSADAFTKSGALQQTAVAWVLQSCSNSSQQAMHVLEVCCIATLCAAWHTAPVD